RVAPHQVRLERRHVGKRHEMLAERAATGVDAVDQPIRRLQPAELRVRGVDARPHRIGDDQGRAARHPDHVPEPDRRRRRNDDRIAHTADAIQPFGTPQSAAQNSLNATRPSATRARMLAPRPVSRTLVLVLALAASAACDRLRPAPEVPNPLNGATRYLCCNLYYEKTTISDVAYQVGTKIPFGTRVHVEHV